MGDGVAAERTQVAAPVASAARAAVAGLALVAVEPGQVVAVVVLAVAPAQVAAAVEAGQRAPVAPDTTNPMNTAASRWLCRHCLG